MSTALTLLLLLGAMWVLGYVALEGTGASRDLQEHVLLSLPVGCLMAAFLFTLGTKTGMRPDVLFWVSAGSALIVSLLRMRLDVLPALRSTFSDGWWLTLISLILASLFYAPGATRDATYLPDGSYNWMYVDTQYFCAMASAVKGSVGSPRLPDMAIVPLTYHYGPHAIAGSLSAAVPISLGDAVARVVRPTFLIALILSAFSLGQRLQRDDGGHGGLLAVTGLFFYGSLSALLAANPTSYNSAPAGVLLDVPQLRVASSGGPFAHVIIGGSQVPSLTALFLTLCIWLAESTEQPKHRAGSSLLTLLPAIVLPSSLLAGVGLTGLLCVLLIHFGGSSRSRLAKAALTLAASVATMWAMGYVGSPMTAQWQFRPADFVTRGLKDFLVWSVVGLGVRLYALARLDSPLRSPSSCAVTVLVVGFVSFGVLFDDEYMGNTRYGLLYAQALLSVVSFAWAAPTLKCAVNGDFSRLASVLASTMRVTRALAFGLVGIALIGWASSSTWHLQGRHWGAKLAALSAVAAVAGVVARLLETPTRIRSFVLASLTAVYALGFLAWVPDWVNFGLGRMGMDITVTPGEVAGLRALQDASQRGDLIATNHQRLPHFQSWPERAYSYGALSERPVLLQGWRSGGAQNHPLFAEVAQDNERLFATRDEVAARQIVDRRGVKFVVAEPGTDMALEKPLPKWLERLPDCGTLTIYRVQVRGFRQ